ncbi:TPA: disulfide bond formation protein DsbA [Candidatus Daviesbacteria bacterium]|nr:disulfide bond formation protein DsbA [Candidatus Daviesbacteria bacterium]HLC62649.1 DsbA family protein [Candidatus Nanoarchaeia archaeon]
MEKMHILTILVSVTLVLALVNVYATLNLNTKLNNLNVAGVPEGSAQDSGNTAPEQQKVEVSPGDIPFKGQKNAPVTIIEFSDFQCPYCERFYTQSLPLIDENYIKTGKVKLYFRNFPLGFHQYAQKAAEASECANEQGKFWEYHNKLFENQNSLDTDSLKKYASGLGLDAGKFNSCLDSGKMKSIVQKDFDDGAKYGVTGTPAFFINGIIVVGAQPYEAFKQIIDQELNK